MSKRVAIIGAGVSGLTTAIVLAEESYECVIFAERLPENTTSAVASAIWFPYDALPDDLVHAWAFFTYGRLLELSRDSKSGVSLTDFYVLSRFESIEVPRWAEVIGYRLLTEADADTPFMSGYVIRVPKMETPKYLPYLATWFTERLGGRIEPVDKLDTIDDLKVDGFDLIVNCSGFGARDLVPDYDVVAHHGQVLVMPGAKRGYAMVAENPLTYIVPRDGDCVLGGINAKEEKGETLPPESDKEILRRCEVAGFEDSGVKPLPLTDKRPFRTSGIRVEAERTSENRLLIHNYGHGGCGLSLSWGCAQKVLHLARFFGSATDLDISRPLDDPKTRRAFAKLLRDAESRAPITTAEALAARDRGRG